MRRAPAIGGSFGAGRPEWPHGGQRQPLGADLIYSATPSARCLPDFAAVMETAIDKLGLMRQKVNLVFITIDPERIPETDQGLREQLRPTAGHRRRWTRSRRPPVLSRLLSESAGQDGALSDGPFLDRLSARPQWPLRHTSLMKRRPRQSLHGKVALTS